MKDEEIKPKDEIDKDVNDEQAEDVKEKDNRTLGEKIDDTMDEVVANVQDFFYGEREDYTHDIPATFVDPDNEIRHINKVQTRRNFNKRYGKVIFKIFGVLFAIGIGLSVITFLISLFMAG